ncbi:MAG: 16S rRNA (uracil(1498)-N(3))-methyltransferase [Chthoniobacterales bacterium]
MARFFVPVEMWHAETAELPGSEARHASQVLRLGVGDRVEIFDGTRRAAQVELVAVGRRGVTAKILREWREERARPEIHLIVALIKNERFDWLVQKATELGAASIRPVAAERSVVRIAAADAEKRRAKWMQVAVEAAKQCGHVVLPEIFAVSAAAEAFRTAPEGLKGIPAVQAGGRALGEFLAGEADAVTFAIGPEGDWTVGEMQMAAGCGFEPVDLGKHVLRSETAALHVLSAAGHVLHGGIGGKR